MKPLSISLLALAFAFGAQAQGVLDLQSRAQLRSESLKPAVRAASQLKKTRADHSSAVGRSFGFTVVADDADLRAIESAGGEVLSRRGNILLTAMPTDSVLAISQLPGVKRMQLSRPVYPKLDKARAVSGIDKIHSGIDLPRAYTGKGVITGIVDGGMDPNHVNFKDADGNTRIKHFTYIRPNAAQTDMLISAYTPEQLPSFKTDDETAYHGTHTMGILAGGFKGEVVTAEGGDISAMANPYYGVATGSDIAASCGQLNDMFIAYGIDKMCEYAFNKRQRMVVNLSLGSNLGTHDGRNVMSQYLDAITKQDNVLFCISAGNEGDLNIALNKTFSAQDTIVKTFIRSTATGADMRYARQGSVQIYSADASAFNTQVVVYNKTRGRVAFRMAVTGNTGGEGRYWVSSSDYAVGSNETVSPELAKAFEGYVGIGSMIDPETGRFYTLVDYMTFNNMTYNDANQYLLGIEVTGKDGQRVDFFCDGIYADMNSFDLEGWSSGSADGSISDMACAESALVVGSYNNRDNWYSLDCNMYGFEGLFEPGKMTGFSSYGTLLDGRQLPHLCAPGATIISSTSSHFVYNPDNGITPAYLQAQTADGEQGYWEQMAGTSMSSPLVAGAMALWLEADPTLTPAQLKEIAISTAVRDEDVTSYPNAVKWGAGKFDAYAGLKQILRNQSALTTPEAAGVRPVVTLSSAKTLNVLMAGSDSLSATVYDLTGRAVKSASVSADELSLDCSDLSVGVYLLSVNGISQKIVIN